jgi:F-type H+-transporting ATPase subunit alpha
MTSINPETGRATVAQRAAWLENYRFGLRMEETGHVVAVGDGIAWISGLPSIAMDDVLVFEDGSTAMVFDLNEKMAGAILLHATDKLTAGVAAHRSRQALRIPIGEGLLGRCIDPLGNPLDGNGAIEDIHTFKQLDNRSPPITAREYVHQPLYTGIKIIDTLIPIGKGQRQLIIGDEGLGRSAVAIDTVINQHDKEVYCVYVLIGQKRSTIVKTIELLREFNALEYTVIVIAEASALPGLQYLAPFAGCTIAEHWMFRGYDTLVIYDDISIHAKTWRELSLLLRRPPGREAYPGDIFSVHARLLERSTCLNAGNGGGSMTALPVVETHEGEIAAYIPTNLISITDGQIYLDRNLFSSGFRPAIDIGKSVSRIGGRAQHPMIRAESGRMKLDYLQFLELEMFTRFGAKLEASIQQAIKRGRILREILQQEQLTPFPAEFHLAWLIAFNDGAFNNSPAGNIPALLAGLQQYTVHAELSLDMERERWSREIQTYFQHQAGLPA